MLNDRQNINGVSGKVFEFDSFGVKSVREKVDFYRSYIWYVEGTEIIHREFGPAVEGFDGTKEWYLNNKKHRLNGPALIYPENSWKAYYILNKRINEEDYIEIVDLYNELHDWDLVFSLLNKTIK